MARLRIRSARRVKDHVAIPSCFSPEVFVNRTPEHYADLVAQYVEKFDEVNHLKREDTKCLTHPL